MPASYFIMQLTWKLFAAFYFPLHFAVGSFYVSGIVLVEKVDCRGLCDASPNSCAELDALIMSDFFVYAVFGLIALAFVLPAIMVYRQKNIIQTSFFS